jgi:SHS2 domain-containing protein
MTKEPTKIDRGWSFLDHTADIRMEVHGTTLEEIFLNAARGFTSLLARESSAFPSIRFEVRLEADNIEDLLVDWLRELIFYHQTQGFIFSSADIGELSGTRLTAELAGRTLGPEEEPEIEIKAVTYHGLSVQKSNAGYAATIVFDI